MENVISILQNLGGVIIGGLISLIASYQVQKQNFMYQQKQSALQQKIEFYDELLSKLPAQTFLSRIDEQKKSDVLPELFTEKANKIPKAKSNRKKMMKRMYFLAHPFFLRFESFSSVG